MYLHFFIYLHFTAHCNTHHWGTALKLMVVRNIIYKLRSVLKQKFGHGGPVNFTATVCASKVWNDSIYLHFFTYLHCTVHCNSLHWGSALRLCELVRKWCFLRLRCEHNARDGFAVHFCRPTARCNALFGRTVPHCSRCLRCSAVQVITWVRGSSKLPRPVREQNFSPVFSKFAAAAPPSSIIIASHWITIWDQLFTSSGWKLNKGTHWRGGGGLSNFLSRILFICVCFQSFHSPPAAGVGSKICIIRVLAPDQIRNIQLGQCQPASNICNIW